MQSKKENQFAFVLLISNQSSIVKTFTTEMMYCFQEVCGCMAWTTQVLIRLGKTTVTSICLRSQWGWSQLSMCVLLGLFCVSVAPVQLRLSIRCAHKLQETNC